MTSDLARTARSLGGPAVAGTLAIPGLRAVIDRAMSEQRLDAIARALGVTREELDHLHRRDAA